jgi:hypothetical protein
MVAADIDTRSSAVSSSMTSSPNCRNTATSSVNIGASLLPAGIPSTSQQTVSAAMTFCPYLGGRGLRLDATTLGCSAALSALRAWLRCQPVLAHNSSRILLLAGLQMLYNANALPEYATKLLRIDAPVTGDMVADFEAWKAGRCEMWSVHHGWTPYPMGKMEIMATGDWDSVVSSLPL